MNLSFSKFGQNAEIKKQIVASFEKGLELFKSKRSFDSSEKVTVIWNSKMRSCAGRAKKKGLEIHLNSRLLSENPNELLPTFLHELAHILDYVINAKSSGHGYAWKRIMVDLGEPVEVYHNMATKHLKAKRRKFQATCSCRTHLIGVRRVNNINRGKTFYTCKLCGAKLVVGKEVFDF